MPLFEYQCTECGSVFEQLVRATQQSQEVICPACKSTTTQKLLSGFAVSGGTTATASYAADCAPGGT